MTLKNKDKKDPLSSLDIEEMKGRYKLPEDAQENTVPKDGYTLGIHFILSILIPALLGIWADKVFQTTPWCFLALFMLGLASGFWYIWRKSGQFSEDKK